MTISTVAAAVGEELHAIRDCLDRGLNGPAVVSAWSVVDEVLLRQLRIDYPTLRDSHRLSDTSDVRAASLRDQLTLHCVSMAMDDFNPMSEDRVPTIPNRHAAAHTLDSAQRTEVNAVLAALIATSVFARHAETTSRRTSGTEWRRRTSRTFG